MPYFFVFKYRNGKIKAKKNKQNEVVNELVHSGKETLYPKDFVNTYDSSDELVTMFKKGVVDNKGRPRMSDSEVKYIFNFMMHHLHKSDTFVIETKNIYYACNSCQREFLMFEEFLKARGKTVKFIIYSDEGILGGDDFYKLLIKK